MVVVFVGLSLCTPGVALADGDNLTGTKWESPKFLDAPITIDQGEAGKPVSAHPFHAAAGFYRGTYDGKRLVLNNTTLGNASETLDCQVSGSQMTCSWITVINGSRDSEPYSFTCANCSGASVTSPLPCGTLVAGVVGALLLLLLIGKRVTRKAPPPPVAPAPPPEPPVEQVSLSGPGWKYGNIVPSVLSAAPNPGILPTPQPAPPSRPREKEEDERCSQWLEEFDRLCQSYRNGRIKREEMKEQLQLDEEQFGVIASTAINAHQQIQEAIHAWIVTDFWRTTELPTSWQEAGGLLALLGAYSFTGPWALALQTSGGITALLGTGLGQLRRTDILRAYEQLNKEHENVDAWMDKQLSNLKTQRELHRRQLADINDKLDMDRHHMKRQQRYMHDGCKWYPRSCPWVEGDGYELLTW